MNTSVFTKRLMLAAAAAFACSFAVAPQASALTWACGSYTCHTPPCNAGETQLPNGDGPNGEYNYDHCVALKVAGTGATASHNLSIAGKLTCKAGETVVTRDGKQMCAANAVAHQVGDMPK